METTYLRGLTLALVWPRNGVGLREVLELSMDDILIILQVTINFPVEREMKVYMCQKIRRKKWVVVEIANCSGDGEV